jgi:hypothetical protein
VLLKYFQIAELELRLNEANEVAARGGRAAMSRLESRIRELEIELGSCQAKTSDVCKAHQGQILENFCAVS